MNKKRFFIFSLAMLLLALSLWAWANPWRAQAQGIDTQPEAVWERVRRLGRYDFSVDIAQTTLPLPKVENIGRESKTQRLYLQGSNNLPERRMNLSLWGLQGGSLLDAASAVEVKVEGERAFTRYGDGEWQESENFTGFFAPEGDFLAFLVAARDVTDAGEETRAGLTFRRYTFRIDGPAFAGYLRDQIERQMIARGELPPGISLDLPQVYAGMSGHGELWVLSNGLPLRQALHLDFPDGEDTRSEAAVTVDFSNFPKQPAAAGWYAEMRSAVRQAAPQAGLMLLAAGLSVVLARNSRSKKLRAAITLTFIVSMVFSPLLQSAQAAAFYTRQAEQAAAQTEPQGEMQKAIQNLQASPGDGPTAADLARIRQDGSTDSDRDGFSDVQETYLGSRPFDAASLPAALPAADDGTDSDADGLSDYEEALLGTSSSTEDQDYDGIADGVDTDSDTITDTLEVQGFTYNGQAWYTNPLELDTNNDGIEDSAEWYKPGAHPTWDTDNDGTPDLFDDDNDNDGVPDRHDLSPFTAAGATFDEDNPFRLVLNGLAPGRPTYVEFQLRPMDSDHLWYAFNVLDWPFDRKAQVQDKDGKTFFDVCMAQGGTHCTASPDDNGDLRLVPMLEITLDGGDSVANLPDPDELEDTYGIIVRPRNDETGSGQQMLAYVPLQLVTEHKTGNHIAFYGKMMYEPAATWGNAQSVRLVWLVQMINDTPDGNNITQIIHTYPDEWALTGLNVRENGPNERSVIYEDPAVDADLNEDGALYQLVNGLGGSFMVGRDCEVVSGGQCRGDGLQDLYIAGGTGNTTFAQRFDRDQNAGVSEQQRWGIPNILQVETRSDTHLDRAIGDTAQVTNREILNRFTDHWSETAPITPTLLYIHQDNFRTANLDLSGHSSVTQWNGKQLTMDFAADGGVPALTTRGFNWAPFRYDPITRSWKSYAIEDYWDELAARYADANPTDPEDVRQGKLAILQFFYLSLYAGVSHVVQAAGVSLTGQMPKLADVDIRDEVAAFNGPKGAAVFAVNTLVLARIQNKFVVWQYLGRLNGTQFIKLKELGTTDIVRKVIGTFREIKANAVTAIGITLAVVAGVTGLLLKFFAADLAKLLGTSEQVVSGVGTLFLSFALLIATVIAPIKAVISATSIVSAAAGISKPAALLSVLGGRSELIGITRKASVVGLIISIGVIVGAFIYTWVTQDVKFGSITANTLIADAISGIIIAVVLFAIALTTVGAIAVAIVGLIDLVFLGLCELGVDALCFSIVGGWVEGLARLIYSGDVAIDTGRDDLVTFTGMNGALVNPNLGLQVGNSMLITATIRTRIYQKPPSSGYSTAYASADDIFTAGNLRAATFKYSLGKTYITITANRNQHPSAWQNVRRYGYVDHALYGRSWYYSGYKTDTKYSGSIPLTAGINEALELRFKAAMAIPSYECWVYVCDTDNVEKADYAKFMGEDLVYDIFPLHLDGFMNVRSWGFGPQRDLDGDGLVASAVFRGSDENDDSWDSDGDGLNDTAELRAGSSNFRTDSDNDGLSDLDEVRLGTNPMRADSDRDGLSDKTELDGWLFEYAPGRFTRVFSEPNNPDSDLDGLNDLLEKNLGAPYHPRVENPRPVALYAETGDDDDFLRPGQRFVYTTTVRNEVAEAWWASGSLVITAPLALGGRSFSSNFVLGSGQESVQGRNLTVQANAGSQAAPIDQSVNARLDQNPNGGGSLGSVGYGSALPLTVDNDRPVSGITGSGYVAAGGTRLLGITASDPTSRVSRVQVRVQNGDWMDAVRDGEFWLFPWEVPTSEGEYVIFTRATDAVGWEQSPAAASSVYVDAHAPTVTVNLAENQVLAAQRGSAGDDGNRWVLALSGTASDPAFGRPASGVALVEVSLLKREPGQSAPPPNDGGWQPATVITATSPNTWSLDYVLPALDENQAVQVTPSGFYTVEVRARDRAGNLTDEAGITRVRIGIDNDAPTAGLSGLDAVNVLAPALDETFTIGGLVTDTGAVQAGVSGVEIALVPAEVVPSLDDRTLSLPLNELPAAVVFSDVSGFERTFYCLPEQCPTSGVPGRFDTAVQFDGSNQYLDPLQLALPLTGFTTSLWFNTTCTDCGIFSADHGHLGALGHDRELYLDAGKVCANLLAPGGSYEAICSIENGFADGQWHHVAHAAGSDGQVLFVDGVQRVRGFLSASAFTTQSGANLGFAPAAGQDYFSGRLDEFVVYNTALTEAEAATLFQAWQPAVVENPGAPVSTWRYDLPSGIEGFYQIDLRPSDALGNRNDRRQDWRQWRGEIDTAYPQVSIQVAYSGQGESAQTHYSGSANDLNLVEAGFVSPCGPQAIERSNYASPWWAQWSNDTPRLYRLSFNCTVPGYQSDNVHLRACDAFGRCAAARPDQYRIFYTSYHTGGYNGSAEAGRIQSASTYDGSDVRALIDNLGGNPVAIALDIPGGKLYWTANPHHPATASIHRANLDGSNPETLISGIPAGTLGPKTLGLALDRAGGKLYWTIGNGIYRANLDGSGAEQLFTLPGQYNVAGVIALDLAAGTMYWTVSDYYGPAYDTGTIWRANLDGTGAQALFPNVPRMTALAFDPAARKLYWMADNVIRRADPDGTNAEDVVTGVNEYFRTGLAAGPNGYRLYWIEDESVQQAGPFGVRSTLLDTVNTHPVYLPWALAIGRIPAVTITQVDLSIAKREPPAGIAVQGGTVSYDLIARNESFLDAHDVLVEDSLPAGLSLAAYQPPAANCAANGSTVSCALGDFASGQALTITLTLDVAPGTSGFLTNHAVITSREQDFAPTNNSTTVARTLGVPAATATPEASARYAYAGSWASVVRVRLDQPGSSEIIVPYNAISSQLYFPIEGVAVDNLNGKLYWPQPYAAKIQRANLDGSGVEDFITGVDQPTFITVHAGTGKVYWLSDYGNTLERANLDGSGRETLLTGLVARSLAVDAVRGKLYWIAATGKVQRAGLNGQDIETLVEDVFGAVELAVDPYGSKIYWIDTDPFRIRRANPDGSQVETILDGFTARPVGLLLDAAAGRLYWFEADTLRRADLNGSGAEDVAANLPHISAYGPYDPMNLAYLALPTNTPSPTTPPSPTATLTPTETPTFDPGATDTPTPTPSNTPTPLPSSTPGGPAPAERIFWADIGAFFRRAQVSGCPDGSCVETLLDRPAGSINDLVVDSGNGFLYWTDPASASILRARLDGTHVTTILAGLDDPQGLAFDPQEGQLYWSETALGRIRRANVDGSEPVTFLDGLDSPVWLALDPFHDRLYWYENRAGFQQQIWQANLDGSGAQPAVTDSEIGFPYYFLEFVTALEVDPEHGWLFWTDTGGSQPGSDFPYGRINRYDLACGQAGGGDSCFATIVQEDRVYPFGLGLDPNAITLYWATYTWDEDTHLPVDYTMKSARMDGTLSGGSVTALIDLPDVIPAAVDVQYPLACQPAADAFEPDDLAGQAVTITLDAPSVGHTFHTADDADWLSFNAEEGQRYVIRTALSGSDVDTLLALYAPDGTTLLLANDNATPGVAYSQITFDPAASERYFLRVVDVNGAASCETLYSVSLATGAHVPLPTGEPGPAPDFAGPALDSAVLNPADGSTLDSLTPIAVSGGAYARDFLQTLHVTVDGGPLFDDGWANGVLTDTIWSASWTPPAEGVYTLEAVVTDWAGRVQTDTHPITVTVDTGLPAISLTPSIYTTTHVLPGSSQIALHGLATDSLGVQRVTVNVDSSGWQEAAFDGDAGTWVYPWPAGSLDDITIPVAAQVTDHAGKTALASQDITVDVVAPLPDGVFLYHQTASGLHEIFPGETVYEANATLVITWTAASDASGLQNYFAGWTASAAPALDDLTSVAPDEVLQVGQVAGEAQVRYAHVVSTDNRGNRTWSTLGPIYVDGPETPDLTGFTPTGIEPEPYGAWRGSGGTQLGADREAYRAGRGQIQRFYATWDAANLRLTWLGADWDGDGDLFVYFDTAGGGATTLFNPYTATATIDLPGGLRADALIWVEDTTTASLYTWNGSDWDLAAFLNTDQFRFSAASQAPGQPIPDYLITDLSLPFSLLGLDPASPLGLLAVASEEDRLSLWASAPDKNPHNSPRVISPLALGRALNAFALNVAYRWPSLDAGIRPNLGRFADSDLQLALQPAPAGVTVGFLESDLLDLLAPGIRLDADEDGEPDAALPLDDHAYPLRDGQTITYTLAYTNTGAQAAPDVLVTIDAYGALSLPGSSLAIDLGDIPAGTAGIYTFQATVDSGQSGRSAELIATVADGPHGEYDWLWVQHDLDTEAPTGLQITAPVGFIRPYTQTIHGLVSDASGAPHIELEIESQAGRAPRQSIQCNDLTPSDGHWACEWNAGSTAGIASFRLRARAGDAYGNLSGWTAWRTLAVDSIPPAVSLDAAFEQALADGFINAAEARITGLVTDDQRATGLVACLGNLPCAPYFVSPGNTPVGTWSLRFPVDELDGVVQSMALIGYDAVDNASTPLERTFTVDGVAPAITATQLLAEVPTNTQHDLLSGNVSDGSGVGSLYLRIQPPAGPATYRAITLSGNRWTASASFSQPGLYTLSVEAYDLAGNYRASQAFNVLVTGPHQVYLPAIAKNAGTATGLAPQTPKAGKRGR
ncbi:MAG: LamG-like jellyroll fold domain-containing protein [Chloroflexota bacterium]